MNSGIISLYPLYEFIRSDLDFKGLERGSPLRRQYGSVAARICESIAPCQGFYLWGRYKKNGLWRNIYLGKAGFGKTAHLKARILEELRDERSCLWRAFIEEEMLLKAGVKNHPKMWHKYQPQMTRALRKVGATHIIWVADSNLKNSAVANIESDLIETLNPLANVSHPIPPHTLQSHTKEIIAEFRSLIHGHRSERFQIRNIEAEN